MVPNALPRQSVSQCPEGCGWAGSVPQACAGGGPAGAGRLVRAGWVRLAWDTVEGWGGLVWCSLPAPPPPPPAPALRNDHSVAKRGFSRHYFSLFLLHKYSDMRDECGSLPLHSLV